MNFSIISRCLLSSWKHYVSWCPAIKLTSMIGSMFS